MMRLFKALALLAGLAGVVYAGAYTDNTINTTTGKAVLKQSGSICVAASSNTPNTCNVLIDGTLPGTVDGYDVSAQFATIATSTGGASTALTALAVSTTALSVSTSALRTDLTAESATRLAADNAIAVSTTAEAATRLAQDLAIGVSTAAESAARIAADTAIGLATNTIRTDFTTADTAIGVATNTLFTTKLASPTVSGVVGNVLKLAANGGNEWGTGGGSGGHTLASGTVVGAQAGVRAGLLAARTTMYFDSAGFELFDDASGDASIVKSKGFQVLASTRVYPNGTIGAGVSTLGECFSQSTATWTQGNNRALICTAGSQYLNAGGHVIFGLLLDGKHLPGYSSTKGITYNTGIVEDISFCYMTETALSAGQHSVCLTAASNGVTVTTPPIDAKEAVTQLSVIELGTGGNGVSASASTSTIIPSNQSTTSSAWTSIPGSTITLTMGGGKLLTGLNCSWSHNQIGQNWQVGLLVNGQYVPGETSVIGLINSEHPQASDDIPGSFTYFSTNSFTGATSLSLIWKTTANTISLDKNSKTACQFWAQEQRNAAGTGDVSSNGNNTFSGSNSFTGPVNFANISGTPFGVIASSQISSGFLSSWTNTTFSVCQATATLDFTGLGKAEIYLSANVENSLALNSNKAWVLMDGQFILGQTSALALQYIVNPAAGGAGTQTINFNKIIDAPATGSHSFCLGMGVGGGTGNFNTANTASPSFGVKELAVKAPGISVPVSTTTTGFGSGVTGTNTTFSSCISGSTVTLVTAGGSVRLSANIDIANTGATPTQALTVLQDGAFLSGYSSTIGVTYSQQPSSNDLDMVMNFSMVITPPSAGSHSYCLAARTSAGTWSVRQVASISRFTAEEVRNVAGTGDAATNGNNTWGGVNTFPSPSGTPEANATYREGQVKAWIRFTGATPTTLDSYNSASLVRNSAGNYTWSFDRDFANANYAVTCNCSGDTTSVCISRSVSHAAGSAGIETHRFDTGANQDATVSCVAIGDQ